MPATAILRSRRDAQILAAFAAAVRELREERELSQSDLAALSGLPVRRLRMATEGKHPAAPSRQKG
jgi:transcriptional regulator with XRE-family HTH domain